jgi:hypothetical protein
MSPNTMSRVSCLRLLCRIPLLCRPYGILILFMSLAYIAASLDATGVFAWLALHITAARCAMRHCGYEPRSMNTKPQNGPYPAGVQIMCTGRRLCDERFSQHEHHPFLLLCSKGRGHVLFFLYYMLSAAMTTFTVLAHALLVAWGFCTAASPHPSPAAESTVHVCCMGRMYCAGQ